MRFCFETLGCRCNQMETAAMERLLRADGHVIVGSGEAADWVILNGCAVTAESARKSRQAARRLLRTHPDARLAVCGCWPQAEPAEAKESGASVIGGSGGRLAFLQALTEPPSESAQQFLLDDPRRRRSFETLPPARMDGRTRAYLKAEDGCQNYCAYCIIPYLRGPVRSLPLEDAARQAAALAAEGVRELTVTGIELASYQYGLAELVETLSQAAPALRLRLGSLEPRIVTEALCVRLREIPRLCPHFHLSLQSGCDETLRRMGRRYNTARFLESVRLLRSHFPGCSITADLITGFPGETEAEFLETLAFLRTCRFAHVHVFPYSERKGTRAAAMPGSVPKAEREERARRAIAEAAVWEAAYLEEQVGTEQELLFESRFGRTPNDCETELLPGAEGELRRVRIVGVKGGRLQIAALPQADCIIC